MRCSVKRVDVKTNTFRCARHVIQQSNRILAFSYPNGAFFSLKGNGKERFRWQTVFRVSILKSGDRANDFLNLQGACVLLRVCI